MDEITKDPKNEKKDTFNWLLEIFGWVRIAFSPFFIGIVIGLGVYLSTENTSGLIIAISFAIVGLIIGIIWATRVWKKKGTLNFLSKVSESKDLDYLDEDNEEHLNK